MNMARGCTNYSAFISAMESVSFSSVYLKRFVDDQLEEFLNLFLPILEQHAPYTACSQYSFKAALLNQSFIDMGQNITTLNNNSYLQYLPDRPDRCFNFTYINARDLWRVLPKCKEGSDKINYNIIYPIFHVVSEPLLYIFNTSLEQGVYPKQWKNSIIIPLNKPNSDTLRPISILNFFAKVFDKLVYEQLSSYVENVIYHNSQYGFRHRRSVESLLLKLVDHLVLSQHMNHCSLIMNIDMSRAFNSVEHRILLDKLVYYGLPHKWFQSFLSNRTQQTLYNGTISPCAPINMGVPQGGSLSPLLFNIYVADMFFALQCGLLYSYADDSTLVISGKSPHALQTIHQLNYEMISAWCQTNNISINPLKTRILLVCPYGTYIKSSIVHKGGCVINESSPIRILGLIVDKYLTFIPHFQTVHSKIINCLLSDFSVEKKIFLCFMYLQYNMPALGVKPYVSEYEIIQNIIIKYFLKTYNLTLASPSIKKLILFRTGCTAHTMWSQEGIDLNNMLSPFIQKISDIYYRNPQIWGLPHSSFVSHLWSTINDFDL